MFEDESLRSKYTRLGVEFKKLRERHRILKDNLKESTDRLASLETRLSDQSIHTRNLEHEKESLIFRNKYLIEHAASLESQLGALTQRHSRSRLNDYTASVTIQDDALRCVLQECNKLHEELVSQSSKFLARIAELESANLSPSKGLQRKSVAVQTSSIPYFSPLTQSTSSVDATSSSLDALHLRDTEQEGAAATNEATSSAKSGDFNFHEIQRTDQVQNNTSAPDPFETNPDLSDPSHKCAKKHSISDAVFHQVVRGEKLSPRETLLIERISQLENELAEELLRQHLETRRLHLIQRSTPNPNPCESAVPSPVDPEVLVREKLLTEFYEGQLLDRNKQLCVYAGRVADAYEEIRNLHERLKSVRREVENYRELTVAAEAKANRLEEELDSTKQRTAQQLTDMAMHLANLTDDIHELRGGHDGGGVVSPANGSNSVAGGFAKNSFFSSLLK
uniref:PID domain-containing protein n=1 Tax=Mesocestoides corti TaxID=53468 RepID=A0A5K3EW55_MESCO